MGSRIEEILGEIELLLTELEDEADKTKKCVYFDGPGYGMGGTYYPPGAPEWEWVRRDRYLEKDYGHGIWRSSSHSC